MDLFDLTKTSLAGNSTARRLMRGGAWATGGKGVTIVATLVLNAVVARLLSPSDLGVYFLILSIIPFAVAIGGLGFKEAVVRLVADGLAVGRLGQARSAVGTGLFWSTLGSLIVAVVFLSGGGRWLATAIFNVPELGDLSGAIAILLVATTLLSQMTESFRGFHDIRLATVTSGLANSLLPALMVGIVWVFGKGIDLSQVLLLHIVALVLTLALAGWWLIGKLSTLGPSEAYTKSAVWSLAIPLAVTDLSLILQARIAIWIVATFMQPNDVALFGAANRLVLLVGTPLILVNAVVPPLIAEMYTLEKQRTLERMIRGISAFAAVPSFVVLVGLVLLGRPVLRLAFGDFYVQAWSVLIILGMGQVINTLAGSCGLTLMMTGHQKALMLIALGSAALQALLGAGLVGPYGVDGVALAVSGVLVAQNIVMVLWVRIKTGLWTFASFSGLLDGARAVLKVGP